MTFQARRVYNIFIPNGGLTGAKSCQLKRDSAPFSRFFYGVILIMENALSIERASDEQLCQMAAHGNRMAEEILVMRCGGLVRGCVRPFFLVGGDSEDLTQEGMLGLLKAIREYDADRETPFRAFAEICVRSRLYSVLRDSMRDKRKALNQSVSFSLHMPDFDRDSYISGTHHLARRDPEEFLIDREHTAALLTGVRKQLSEFEAKVLGYYLDGLSCGEIADAVGKSPKSVDNAVQRIRRKVARQILSGESSES